MTKKLKKIPLSERWRLCIDPAAIDAIEQSPVSKRLQHLKPLLYDCFNWDKRHNEIGHREEGYFVKMAKGWEIGLKNLENGTTRPILDEINATCSNGKINPEEKGWFNMVYGFTLTKEGLQEFKDFNASLGNQTFAFTEYPRKGVSVTRNPTDPEKFASIMDGILDDLDRCVKSDLPETTKESREFQATQQLSRLHYYTDGNARTLAVIGLNRIRRAQGKSLLFWDDPNRVDGLSLAQLTNSEPGIKRTAADLLPGQQQGSERTHLGQGRKEQIDTGYEAKTYEGTSINYRFSRRTNPAYALQYKAWQGVIV